MRRAEQHKRREYDERVRRLHHADFSPFAFNAAGQLSPAAHAIVKRLALEISSKSGEPMHTCLAVLRAQLSFCLSEVRSVVWAVPGPP